MKNSTLLATLQEPCSFSLSPHQSCKTSNCSSLPSPRGPPTTIPHPHLTQYSNQYTQAVRTVQLNFIQKKQSEKEDTTAGIKLE